MPEGASYVGRPGPFGNPFTGPDAVERHAWWLRRPEQRDLRNRIRRELRGRDLACWCPLVDAEGRRVPCHADELLLVANS